MQAAVKAEVLADIMKRLSLCVHPAGLTRLIGAAWVLAMTLGHSASAQQLLIAPPPRPKLDVWSEFFDIGAAPEAAAVQRGKELFATQCSFCHGTTATGGNKGPNLMQSVVVLHDGGTGTELGKVVRAGRESKGMPAFALQDAQITDIAAFLLSRYQSIVNRKTYRLANLVTGDAAAGQVYFQAHCASCHSPSQDLAHVAAKFDTATLERKLLFPRDDEDPMAPVSERAMRSASLTLPSGEVVIGKMLFQDDFRVTLLVDGKQRVIDFEDGRDYHLEVHDPLAGHHALLSSYADGDIHNLLSYLETLR